MKYLLTVIGSILAMIAINAAVLVARAADLPNPGVPVKAPAFFVDTSGPYWGIEAGAGVQQASANSSLFANSLVSGKLTAAGGTVGGCLGYIWGRAERWYALQGCLDYQNIAAGEIVANQPVGVASRWSGTLEARIGGTVDPLATISGVLSSLGISGITFPTFKPVPPGGVDVADSTPRSYVAAGFEGFGISGSVGKIDGANVAFAPMLKLGAIWPVYAKKANPAGVLVEVPTGGAVDVSAMVSWPIRGFAIDNLGGTSGSPTFIGGVDTGTRYMGKVAFLFPVPR